ncbi:hypothetical protein SAMN04488132_104238 [Sediminibacterium ginsengisoli]|uniref:Uncharacterized protein n=1 Tax=Sediminibacterium ginsengisoli TaxID=413434 RepID=A0A1T4NFS6_9BACT|nr:hypothetical protein SAMN04488132_104238 [Sediminibacterium ginsengisoli]
MFLTHQYLDQLTEDTRHAVLGNVGTMIAFRLGTKDAKVFANEFYPVLDVEDFINLPRFYFYINYLLMELRLRHLVQRYKYCRLRGTRI